jgi:hypothetical protein
VALPVYAPGVAAVVSRTTCERRRRVRRREALQVNMTANLTKKH